MGKVPLQEHGTQGLTLSRRRWGESWNAAPMPPLYRWAGGLERAGGLLQADPQPRHRGKSASPTGTVGRGPCTLLSPQVVPSTAASSLE